MSEPANARRHFMTAMAAFAGAAALPAAACASSASPATGAAKAQSPTTPTTKENHMPFMLPELPYAENALEPSIDARTMNIHRTKHHQAYVDNLNKALEG